MDSIIIILGGKSVTFLVTELQVTDGFSKTSPKLHFSRAC